MATVTVSAAIGKGFFEGTSNFRDCDDAADNFVAGVYQHSNLDFSGTELGELISYFLFLNQMLGSGAAALPVRNETGGALAAGTIVQVSGYSAGQSKCLITAASPAGFSSGMLLVLSDVVANNANGWAYVGAAIAGIDTSAAVAVGSKVYLAAAGALAFDAAPGGVTAVEVGIVTAKDALAGAVQLYPASVSRVLGPGTITPSMLGAKVHTHYDADHAVLDSEAYGVLGNANATAVRTFTLAAAPTEGLPFEFVRASATHALIIDGNGKTIRYGELSGASLQFDTLGMAKMEFDATADEWIVSVLTASQTGLS